jgi:hypothetical protein
MKEKLIKAVRAWRCRNGKHRWEHILGGWWVIQDKAAITMRECIHCRIYQEIAERALLVKEDDQ